MKHESDRKPGKYDLLLAAKEMAGHTIRLTSNENHFPKRYRLTVANKIQDQAVFIVDCLIMAYEIYPNTLLELDRRILYQKQARAACRSMLTLMDIAKEAFGIDAGSLRYWTSMVVDVRKHTTGWIKSDLERFKTLRGMPDQLDDTVGDPGGRKS